MQAAEYEIREGWLLIRLCADLDHHSAMAVRETADRMLERSGVKNVLFDLTEFCKPLKIYLLFIKNYIMMITNC